MCLVAQLCLIFVTPLTVAHQAPLSMGFSRREYWKGCHFLLQGIFLTQGSNSCLFHLLHCRQILYHLSHQGSLHLHINIQEHRFEFEPISDNLGLNPKTCVYQMCDLNNAHLLGAQMVKNRPAMWETWVRFLSPESRRSPGGGNGYPL